MTKLRIARDHDVRFDLGIPMHGAIYIADNSDSQESRDADRRDKWANEREERVVIVNDGFWLITEDVEGYR